jgi:hypothetical protein
MQAQQQLRINRFPQLWAIVLFALVAAMVLGGALGYTLRPSTAGPAQSHASVQQNTTGANPAPRHDDSYAQDANPSTNSGARATNLKPF